MLRLVDELPDDKNNPHRGRLHPIEIVRVIAVLGVLAAIAVARFVDLSEGAHAAAAKAMHGGFSSAVKIIQAEWQAPTAGAPLAATISAFTSTRRRPPVGTTSSMTTHPPARWFTC